MDALIHLAVHEDRDVVGQARLLIREGISRRSLQGPNEAADR
jgi:hypothetical protein